MMTKRQQSSDCCLLVWRNSIPIFMKDNLWDKGRLEKDQAFFNVRKAEKIDIKHKPQQQLAVDLK